MVDVLYIMAKSNEVPPNTLYSYYCLYLENSRRSFFSLTQVVCTRKDALERFLMVSHGSFLHSISPTLVGSSVTFLRVPFPSTECPCLLWQLQGRVSAGIRANIIITADNRIA